MSAFSDYLEDKFLRYALRGEELPPSPASVYLALFTSATGDIEGAGDEVVGNGYERIRITFAEPVDDIDGGKYCANDSVLFSPKPSTAPWGNISHFAIYDEAAGGNRQFHGALLEPRMYETNDLFYAGVGDIKVKLK
jgi:hypothetical protein